MGPDLTDGPEDPLLLAVIKPVARGIFLALLIYLAITACHDLALYGEFRNRILCWFAARIIRFSYWLDSHVAEPFKVYRYQV